MFHKLLHRGLPGYFDFNSVYAMQPMYTSAANEKIVKKLGTLDQYSLKPPVAPKALVVEDSHAKIVALLQNKKEYQVAWPRSSKVAAPDALVANYNRWQQSMLGDKIYQQTKPKAMFLDYLAHKAVAYLERDSFELGKSWFQVDFVRE